MSITADAIRALLKDPTTGKYLIPYVDVAEAAKTDKDGNEITATYATKVEMSGKEDAGVCLPLTGGTMSGKITGTITNADYAASAGSATSATKATQDSAGQQINTTYIKNVSVNGRTITFTRGNGTTFTITTQDTVTTNSSNWSVSNGTNGWARDNSTGFTIAWMTVNANAGGTTNFPRSFSAVYSVQRTIISDTSGPSKNNEIGVASYSNSAVSVGSNYWPSRFVVVGFS